jgi:DNA-binding transcriptional ArsR family regulator
MGPIAATRPHRAETRRPRRVSDDDVFRALADPTRRRILSLLRERRRSVGEIASNFRVSRPAISKHLRLLRDAGLVVDRPEGTSRVCELNAAPLQQIDNWLETYKTFWTHSLEHLKKHVENQR